MAPSQSDPATPRVPRRWRGLARAAWWVLAGYPSLLFILGLAPTYAEMSVACDPLSCATSTSFVLTPDQALDLQANGISLALYAALIAGLRIFMAAVFAGCGLLIFLRRPDERIAFIASLALVVLGTYLIPGLPDSALDALPWLRPLAAATYVWGNWVFPALVFVLPDGRFVPRWGRWFFILWGVLVTYIILTTDFDAPTTDTLTNRLASIVLPVCVAVGVYGQIYRYRQDATPLMRKQILWIGLGLVGFALGFFVGGIVLGPINAGTAPITALVLAVTLTYLGAVSFPLALAVAILRYRLWDIDLIIRRTLIYSSLTAALVLVYFSCVVALQALVGRLAGEDQPALVTVLSTLAIAALFIPLRRRVQDFIDRRFFRRKYDAARTLAGFAASARDETDLDRLSAIGGGGGRHHAAGAHQPVAAA
jgi:hypothetical protein